MLCSVPFSEVPHKAALQHTPWLLVTSASTNYTILFGLTSWQMVVMTSEVTLDFEWLFLPLHQNMFGFSLFINFLSVRLTEKTSEGIDKCQNSYRNFSILEILFYHIGN